ncbi:hypothetical protein BJX66DRAFT_336851 [Aspergillus keveii]|uniref:Heterokaryon incompatibility domain-containing protein n=1 Tax=Aspergillus keveii TaxID=714993 RepID=A0ABR4G915_9EURO
MSDQDHPEFDNDGIWPRRLLHVPTLTSYKWQPGNTYNGQSEPHYNAISYTWGRWAVRADDIKEPDSGGRLAIKGVPWQIPQIDPAHFSVEQFSKALQQAVQRPPLEAPLASWKASRLIRRILHPPEFLWLDIACIDQRGTAEGKAEIGRQARIFRCAKAVYIWLSRTSHSDMVFAEQYLSDLVDQSLFPERDRDSGALPAAPAWNMLSGEIRHVLSRLTADPWFSSLWTLQEGFLCPRAIFMAPDAQYVKREEWPTFTLSSFVSWLVTISGECKRALTLQDSSDSDTSNWQDTKELIALIESIGAQGINSGNPMAVLTMARFRKATNAVDYVYGIMQVFGDECRVGETAPKAHLCNPHYTVSHLQDELGRLLLDQYPIISQLHYHLDPPPLGKGWRVCARSAEASTRIGFGNAISSHPNIGDPDFNPDDLWGGTRPGFPYTVGSMVSRCRLSTTTVHDTTWGYFSGRACDFHLLQQAWSHNYCFSYDGLTRPRHRALAHLGLALDALPVLQDKVLPLYARGEYMDLSSELHYEIAQELSAQFPGTAMVVLLLGERRFLLDDGYVDDFSTDDFVGLILLSQTLHDGTPYWQRIGVCHWNSYLVKPDPEAGDNDADADTLTAQGRSWEDLHGVFG